MPLFKRLPSKVENCCFCVSDLKAAVAIIAVLGIQQSKLEIQNTSKIRNCCFCITDLKTAVAIIAVLGIVTSPAVSWAIVRHSYVIRMSCMVTTSATRPDVMDINFNNVLSFGFGANAGLSPSCLQPPGVGVKPTFDQGDTISIFRSGVVNPDKDKVNPDKNSTSTIKKLDTTIEIPPEYRSNLLKFIKIFGWIVLSVDLLFVIASVVFLIKLFRETELPFMKVYMWSLVIATLLSFAYGMTYVIVCIAKGGSIPIFELVFVFFDLIFLFVWVYFIFVLRAYYKQTIRRTLLQLDPPYSDYWSYMEYLKQFFYHSMPHSCYGGYSYFWETVYWLLGRERQARGQ